MPAGLTVLATASAGAVGAYCLRNLIAAQPGVHAAHAFNARSPGRDRAFLARLFDRVLAGRQDHQAVLCDIGGAGQIGLASDPAGRIGTVIEVNDPRAVPGAITEQQFHALARTDLDVVVMFGVGMYLDEDQLRRYLESARARLRPDGWLVVGDPEYGSGLARSLRSMAMSWLLATRIDYKPFTAVARIAGQCGFRLVHLQTYAGDWYVACLQPT